MTISISILQHKFSQINIFLINIFKKVQDNIILNKTITVKGLYQELEKFFRELLRNFIIDVDGVEAVAICDRDGFIIALESREESEESESDSFIGVISAAIDSSIDRFKKEFGTSNFLNITSIGEKKFAFASMGPSSILTTVANPSTTDVELKVYSEHIAGKIEQIIDGNEVDLEIPAVIKSIAKTRGGRLPKGEFSTKLIITGDYQVGKTSLIKRFVENSFSDNYISTIGVEIHKKVLDIIEGTEITFIIWDIGGQRQEMTPHRARFYGGANAAFITLDRTRPKTLENVRIWFEDIRNTVQQRIPVVIIGNKSDLEELSVSEEDIKNVADEYGFHYILTSAKTGANVNDAFLYIAFKYLENVF